MSNDISVDTSKVDTKRTGFNSNGNRNNFVKNQRKTNSNFSVTNHQEINMLQYPTYERSDGTHIWHQNGQKAAMNNNNGYGVELTSSMAQNSMPTNYGRYQVANGQFVGTMNSAPMFATVDVAGGYNAIGATYQQYYPFTQTVYNPAEIFQNQLAYATLPGAIAYNAPPPAAFSRPPPHLPTAQAQMIGNSTGQQTGYTNQAAATSMSENMNQYFNTNTQNTGSQPSSRFSTNNKVKQLSLFDNSSENYTASWVSSTSSIPPDLKVSPDHNSNPASPANEFAGNWTNEHGGASGSHPPLQHSSSVDEFAAGASATSGFSPPVDPSLDQQLNNMNATHNAAYSFPGQVQQIPTMNHSPVYFPTSVGQTYFPNSTGQSAYFPNSGTGQMMSKVSNLNDYQQVQHNATELGKKFEQTIQQQHLSGNTNTGVTGSSSNTASWANVVKRSGNCSVGETRIRTVIAEPQQNLPQNQNTGISGNGNEHRSAGVVGDNRNRNNRNNSRYQGNSRNYNQNRIQTNNETSGQSNNTYSQRTNQNGGNRYTNQQTQGNNQYQNQRQISSDGNTKNEGNLLDTNKVRPLNATQIPPPNNMNINHMNVQQASSSPNIMPTMLTTAPVANFYMPPHSVATGFSPQNVQQQRTFQANQWNPTTPVPLAAINPAQQFISRPSPPVHNGPQQPTFSGMTQQFQQPASAPPGLVTPLYGNNQQLAPQKVNFKGSWLDQDMIPKDQTLMNYEMAMYVQNHNQNIAGWKAARMTTPNNPAIKNFSPQQGGLLYVILGSTNFPPRFGSPQQNPRVRRFRALHNQQIQRGKGGSPLKAYKKKSAKEEDENNPDEEKSTQEGEKDEDNKNEDENGVPEDGRKEAGYAGVDLEQKLSDVNLNGDK